MTGITSVMDARFLWDVLQTLVILALWLRRPGDEAGKRVKDIQGEIDVLKERLNHMPLRNELTKLEGSVSSMQASLEAMRTSSATTAAAVNRIEAFLLQAGSR